MFVYKYFFEKYLKHILTSLKEFFICKETKKKQLKKKNSFLQACLHKLKYIKKLKECTLVKKNNNNDVLHFINTTNVSHLINLFIVRLIVKKNNVYAYCYLMYQNKEKKQYKKKLMFMLTIGKLRINNCEKKTRPSYERLSRQFFVKLKNYQYFKFRRTMTSYNIIFDLKNFFFNNIFWVFYSCMPKKYYNCKYILTTYKLPHNKGIRKKKKRRI